MSAPLIMLGVALLCALGAAFLFFRPTRSGGISTPHSRHDAGRSRDHTRRVRLGAARLGGGLTFVFKLAKKDHK